MSQDNTRNSREDPKPLPRNAPTAAFSTRGVVTADLPVILHETMAVADLDAAEQDLERWDGLS